MKVNSAFSAISARVFPSFSLLKLSAFSALSARIIALRIENPYSILRQIANLPQPMMKVDSKLCVFRAFCETSKSAPAING